MSRLTFCLAAITVAVFTQTARAEADYMKWFKFFEGDWVFQDEEGTKGELTFRIVDGGHAMIGERTVGKRKAVQLVGWQPDKKALVDTLYSSDGSHYTLEYKDIDPEKMVGIGKSSDGSTGTTTVTKLDDDTVQAKIDRTNANGEVEELTITFHRKPKE